MKEKKKKIFLVMCYLLVSVAMISTISWARYKKDIDAKIIIPEVADFQASLQLQPDGEGYILVDQLIQFKPGETATDNYAAKKHGIKFTVDNAAITPQGQEREVSEKPISYTLRVYGKGNMPLSLLLYDDKGKQTYTPVRTKTEDGYLYTFNDVNPGVVEKEHEFTLPTTSYDANPFVLYLGWQPASGTEDYDDRKYMKEVERLEIRATVRAQSTGMELPDTEPVIPKPATTQ